MTNSHFTTFEMKVVCRLYLIPVIYYEDHGKDHGAVVFFDIWCSGLIYIGSSKYLYPLIYIQHSVIADNNRFDITFVEIGNML